MARVFTHISEEELALLDPESAFAKRVRGIFKEQEQPWWGHYIEQAQKEYGREGECEIDDDACVSQSDDGGAYVQAWVWVYDKCCPECDEPVRFGEVCQCAASVNS